MRKHSNQYPSLNQVIVRHIGLRVAIALLVVVVLLLCGIFIKARADVVTLEQTIEHKAQVLRDYIVLQYEINNAAAVNYKLKSLSRPFSEYNVEWRAHDHAEATGFCVNFITLTWHQALPVFDHHHNLLGYLWFQGNLLHNSLFLRDLLEVMLPLLLVLVLFIVLLYPVLRKEPKKLIIDPVFTILETLRNKEVKPDDDWHPSYQTQELAQIDDYIQSLLQETAAKSEQEAKIKIASQVAHDIRSPLTALNCFVNDIDKIPEESRLLVLQATQRVNDIANNLLSVYNGSQEVLAQEQETQSAELLFCLINEVLSEKRAIHKAANVNFEFVVHEGGHSLFAKIEPQTFRRVISNLLNNAVEACADKDEVKIAVVLQALNQQQLKISITDNGSGMSEAVRQKVLQQAVSVGKEGGSGIGLSTARAALSRWDGVLDLASTLGEGTSVILYLPLCVAPLWFCHTLDLQQNFEAVVVLDDDQSIHSIWYERFKAADLSNRIDFYGAQELKDWVADADINLKQSLFLIDYELLGDTCTGLDLIEKLELGPHAYLVTSRYEDAKIRQRIEALGLKIIPKYYVPYLPVLAVSLETKTAAEPVTEFILIDDNILVRDLWRRAAKKRKVAVKIYETFADFEQEREQFAKNTKIYLDSNLKGEEKGEVLALQLFEAGFTELYIATGESGERLERIACLSHIKGVQGKAPPF